MRTVFFLLIFQLIAPAFLPVAQALYADYQKPSSIQMHHSAILLPLLEKEENEHEESLSNFTLTHLIIDFNDHTLALAELHELVFNPEHFGITQNHQPSLFTLSHAYLI